MRWPPPHFQTASQCAKINFRIYQTGKEETMTKSNTIGIDLAKSEFAVVQLSAVGKELKRRKLRRGQLLPYLAKQCCGVVALEACGSAHYWGREIALLGHEVKLLPPQHVKGYQRGQKNDYNDALAIAEASLHGRVRPVRVKSVSEQDAQTLLVLRRGVDRERTRLVNQVRGLLAEYGVVMPKGVASVRSRLPELLEDAENTLSARFRELLGRQYQRLLQVEEELAWYDRELASQVKTDEVCQRLDAVPGFGVVVSCALKHWLGDGKQFARGRDASAALGVVPRQETTGGKEKLLGISKKGDRYVRSLVIHGARSVVARADTKTDPLSLWIQQVKARRGFNKATVALANKLIRIAWVIVARGEQYRPRHVTTE